VLEGQPEGDLLVDVLRVDVAPPDGERGPECR
jgi:hypothetical protein